MKKWNPTRKQILILLVLALVVSGAVAYAMLRTEPQQPSGQDSSKTEQTGDGSGETAEEAVDPEVDQREQQDSQSPGTSQPDSGQSDPGAPPSDGTQSNATVKPVVTYAGQNGSNVNVTVLVSRQSSGTCTLNLTKGGSPTITRTTSPKAVATDYYCSFDVPRSQFATAGSWSAVVDFSGAGGKGTSDPAAVTVN